jgi:hypothetical protein
MKKMGWVVLSVVTIITAYSLQKELDPTNKIGQENYNRAMTGGGTGGAISEGIRALITLIG